MDVDDPTLSNILDAARRLIAEEGYSTLNMAALARTAGVPLSELYRRTPDRVALLEALIRQTDLAVLARMPPAEQSEPARDRLFDLLMARFEATAPNKAVLRVIRIELPRQNPLEALRLSPTLLNAMRWMAEAAGVRVDGMVGQARLRALIGVYLSVMPVWLDDEDPGLSKTMAALDRRLRRLESFWPGIWSDREEGGRPKPRAAGSSLNPGEAPH